MHSVFYGTRAGILQHHCNGNGFPRKPLPLHIAKMAGRQPAAVIEQLGATKEQLRMNEVLLQLTYDGAPCGRARRRRGL